MPKHLIALLALPLALFMVSAPALAHHGGAAYDTSTLTTLNGTITDFQFIQPHPLILLDVKDANGRTPLALAVRACVDSYWTGRRSP